MTYGWQVNPLQMLLIVVMNVAAYCGNKFLSIDYRKFADLLHVLHPIMHVNIFAGSRQEGLLVCKQRLP